MLNLTALACGNRFGRSWLAPGGAAFDLEPARAAELRERLQKALADIRNAVDLLWNTPSVLARFEDAGPVTKEAAVELGLVGPAARACGLDRDVRFELPAGIWRFTHIPISCWHDGDVFARAYVRWLEIQRSADFILAQLESLPEGPIRSPVGPPAPDRFVVSMTEGWRGEICHVAITDDARPLRALQSRRPVVPQLDGPGAGAARTSRFPISRCATRASTFRTAGTICEIANDQSPDGAHAAEAPDDPLAGARAGHAGPFSRAAGDRALAMRGRLPLLRRVLPDRRDRANRDRAAD